MKKIIILLALSLYLGSCNETNINPIPPSRKDFYEFRQTKTRPYTIDLKNVNFYKYDELYILTDGEYYITTAGEYVTVKGPSWEIVTALFPQSGQVIAAGNYKLAKAIYGANEYGIDGTALNSNGEQYSLFSSLDYTDSLFVVDHYEPMRLTAISDINHSPAPYCYVKAQGNLLVDGSLVSLSFSDVNAITYVAFDEGLPAYPGKSTLNYLGVMEDLYYYKNQGRISSDLDANQVVSNGFYRTVIQRK